MKRANELVHGKLLNDDDDAFRHQMGQDGMLT
jgi:hypothetical protein